VALGVYGYKWADPNKTPADPPNIRMTIRKYTESMINPQMKIFSVSANNITTGEIVFFYKSGCSYTCEYDY